MFGIRKYRAPSEKVFIEYLTKPIWRGGYETCSYRPIPTRGQTFLIGNSGAGGEGAAEERNAC